MVIHFSNTIVIAIIDINKILKYSNNGHEMVYTCVNLFNNFYSICGSFYMFIKRICFVIFLFLSLFIYATTEEKKEEDLYLSQIAMSSSDYLVTAGDIYELGYLVGTVPVKYTIFVDSSYIIRVSNLAKIKAYGKTFVQLKEEIESIVTRNYPMGGAQLVILQPASFKIHLQGEVLHSVEKKVWALTRLSDILDDCKTDFSSIRNIKVVSENGKEHICDLFKYYRNGDYNNNPFLRPNDKIILSRYDRKVSISGAVERQGTYELLNGENLSDLINTYGGGLLERADTSRIELERNFEIEKSSGKKKYLSQKDIDENYKLKNKDSIIISTYSELKPVLFLEGAIVVSQDNTQLVSSNRKAVNFTENERYDYFIRKNKHYFSETADLKNSYIKRNEKIIPIDLEKILFNYDYKFEEVCQKNDELMIPFFQSFVTVSGAVLNPGRYPYIPDRTWEYYVNLAGGFNKLQNSNNKIVIKNKENIKVSKKEYITPETIIIAESNSFTYYFNNYAPIITTLLSIASTVLTITAVTQN